MPDSVVLIAMKASLNCVRLCTSAATIGVISVSCAIVFVYTESSPNGDDILSITYGSQLDGLTIYA